MVQAIPKTLTLEEFLQLPETKPASEYINGKVIQKPMPQGKHSTIQLELSAAIHAVLKPAKIARVFTELRCTFGGCSLVPDSCVFTWERIERDKNGEIANVFRASPDWAIEILSPEQGQTKVLKNILHCLQYQTTMAWLIDPSEKTVLVYRPQQQIEVFDEPDQVIPVPDFAKNFQVTVAELFGTLELERSGKQKQTTQKQVREGWLESLKTMSENGDDRLAEGWEIMTNQWDEEEWEW